MASATVRFTDGDTIDSRAAGRIFAAPRLHKIIAR
jgi:hypothetical protein